MFSGIIDQLGRVQSVTREAGSLILDLDTGYADLALGESVAVNGVCLTVVNSDEQGRARFFASPETLARTNLGGLAPSDRVNLERAVSLATRLSGHMVQGHVDGAAELRSVTPDNGAWRLSLAVPRSLGRYCVEKGSIALDGISLTLNSVKDAGDETLIGITIIPHTWTHTTLSATAPGDRLNVEVDVIAKYVERLCVPLTAPLNS